MTEFFCTACQRYVTPNGEFCPRCNTATIIHIPKATTLEGQLAQPIGTCMECEKLGLTGNECWEKHFGGDVARRS